MKSIEADLIKNQTLEIKVALQILKPVHEVFQAIVDPVKMSNYFFSKGSGKMEEGKQIIWSFPEFDTDLPIRVGKMEKDKYISYFWNIDGNELLVEMTLAPRRRRDHRDHYRERHGQ